MYADNCDQSNDIIKNAQCEYGAFLMNSNVSAPDN